MRKKKALFLKITSDKAGKAGEMGGSAVVSITAVTQHLGSVPSTHYGNLCNLRWSNIHIQAGKQDKVKTNSFF